eukprot:1158378-Pelagomonas_calceolata.AAC.3
MKGKDCKVYNGIKPGWCLIEEHEVDYAPRVQRMKDLRLLFGRVQGKSLPITPTDRRHLFPPRPSGIDPGTSS